MRIDEFAIPYNGDGFTDSEKLTWVTFGLFEEDESVRRGDGPEPFFPLNRRVVVDLRDKPKYEYPPKVPVTVPIPVVVRTPIFATHHAHLLAIAGEDYHVTILLKSSILTLLNETYTHFLRWGYQEYRHLVPRALHKLSYFPPLQIGTVQVLFSERTYLFPTYINGKGMEGNILNEYHRNRVQFSEVHHSTLHLDTYNESNIQLARYNSENILLRENSTHQYGEYQQETLTEEDIFAIVSFLEEGNL